MPVTVPKDRIQALLGRKVRLSTHGQHYLCGALEAVRDDRLVLRVQGRELLVDRWSVASLEEAHAEEAEFLK